MNFFETLSSGFLAVTLMLLYIAVLGGILALIAKMKGKSWLRWGVIGAVCGLIPVIGFIVWLVLLVVLALGGSGDTGSETSAAAKSFGQGAQHNYVGGKTGIAIDPMRKIVRLKDGKIEKEYPFTDIREWRTNLASGGEVIAVGGGYAGIAAAGQNVRAARENRKASGLFVSVRDIDRPEWRIDMPNEKNQKRWMEIMRQTINND